MRVTYIGHSGFLVELENCYLIFDYYQGELPCLSKNKPAIVFASHFHGDHYNKEIFSVLKSREVECEAVLAKDINPKKYPENVHVTKVYAGNHYEIASGVSVNTLFSTDSGVAFVVKTDEGVIYHSGDLNDWYWDGEPARDNKQMTQRYRKEISTLESVQVDVAFVVLDPRQGNHYADGMLYFLEHVNCNTVYPMHYWNDYSVIERFTAEYPQYKSVIKNTEKTKDEEIFYGI